MDYGSVDVEHYNAVLILASSNIDLLLIIDRKRLPATEYGLRQNLVFPSLLFSCCRPARSLFWHMIVIHSLHMSQPFTPIYLDKSNF